MEKQDDESFMDFLFRYYDSEWQWQIRKRFGPKWFYYSKWFLRFIKFRGIVLILAGLVIGLAVFFVSRTEYGIFLDIEL